MMHHWRAEQLGPETPPASTAGPWPRGGAGYYWDEAGVLLPLEPSVIGMVRWPGAGRGNEGRFALAAVTGWLSRSRHPNSCPDYHHSMQARRFRLVRPAH